LKYVCIIGCCGLLYLLCSVQKTEKREEREVVVAKAEGTVRVAQSKTDNLLAYVRPERREAKWKKDS
jgi:hypothetical protein